MSGIEHLLRASASILAATRNSLLDSHAEEDYKMKAGYRYLSFPFLTATLAAPAAITTSAASQEDNRRNDQQQTRVYDRAHKDYHNWDTNEDRSYRQYLGDQHKNYRGYSKLNRNQQNQYWNWRHSHPDGGQEKN